MQSAWQTGSKILTGFFVTAMYAMPQAYTISAKPGVVNYVEGNAFVNGRQISAQGQKATFLNANDTISTDVGKAEVLLTPGVFLRVGNNTQVRMISPSLTDTQVEVTKGEAMIEADDIVKDSHVSVIDGGGVASIEKNGLYRFTADPTHSIAVLEGKAQVSYGDRKTDIGKGKEVNLEDNLKSQKFDTKKTDDLFAWSNVRSEYNAASSYQAARDVSARNYGGVWGDYGFSGGYSPGWLWNSGFNSWAWLPGNSAFYSPFGYGFYGPGVVAYAPVIYAPIGGGYYGGYPNGTAGGRQVTPAALKAITGKGPATAAVPVNAAHPPAIGTVTNSFAANQAARAQAAQSFSSTGFRTASGGTISPGRAAAQFGGASSGGSRVSAASSSGAVSGARSSGGGFSGGRSGGSLSGASAGGGAHSSGGGGGSTGASHR